MARLAELMKAVAAPPRGIGLADLAGMPTVVECGAASRWCSAAAAARVGMDMVDRLAGATVAGHGS